MIGRIIHGLFIGYAATAVMDTSQTTIIPVLFSSAERFQGSQQGSRQQGESSGGGETQDSSPARVARRGAELLGIQLGHEEAEKWGNRVHWVYGITWGTAYQLLVRRPGVRSGLVYGAGLWLGSDELLLWGLGIAKAPTSYPPKSHLQALAAHLVFGVTAGLLAR